MDLGSIIKNILKENENLSIKDLKNRNFDVDSLIQKKPEKIITLNGFRRVGKTCLLFLLMEKIKNEFCVYFNFEDERIPEKSEVLTELIYAIEELYNQQPSYLFF